MYREGAKHGPYVTETRRRTGTGLLLLRASQIFVSRCGGGRPRPRHLAQTNNNATFPAIQYNAHLIRSPRAPFFLRNALEYFFSRHFTIYIKLVELLCLQTYSCVHVNIADRT